MAGEASLLPSTAAVLGIESSCDETAAAVLRADGTILAEIVLSQQAEHAPFGGVVPEIAARAHLEHLPRLVRQVMTEAGLGFADLAAVAATSGPGLIGGLIVGAGFGKGVAIAHRLPFVAINHLEAHALTARLPGIARDARREEARDVDGQPARDAAGQPAWDADRAPARDARGDGARDAPKPTTEAAAGMPAADTCNFPYLLLLISGGHCQCVAVEGVGRYRRLGTTLDDSVGEAFDKVAKLLGLPWPGGPALERLALAGDAARIPLPRPMFGRPGCDFSWSGLKTAVAQVVGRHAAADLAAGFQAAAVAVLADRAAHALAMLPEATALVVAGGVAANASVRAGLGAVAVRGGVKLIAPPARLCTDNAVMVAWAGIERLRLGLSDALDHAPRPRWPLEELRG